MTDAQAVVGATYSDLPTTALFAGHALPEREKIVDQSYVSVPDRGFSLVLPDDLTVSAVQLYANGVDGFRQYDGELPSGLGFGMTREAVRARLGAPAASGEAKTVVMMGQQPAWDRFFVDGVSVHLRYGGAGGGVDLATLSRPKI